MHFCCRVVRIKSTASRKIREVSLWLRVTRQETTGNEYRGDFCKRNGTNSQLWPAGSAMPYSVSEETEFGEFTDNSFYLRAFAHAWNQTLQDAEKAERGGSACLKGMLLGGNTCIIISKNIYFVRLISYDSMTVRMKVLLDQTRERMRFVRSRRELRKFKRLGCGWSMLVAR